MNVRQVFQYSPYWERPSPPQTAGGTPPQGNRSGPAAAPRSGTGWTIASAVRGRGIGRWASRRHPKESSEVVAVALRASDFVLAARRDQHLEIVRAASAAVLMQRHDHFLRFL